MRFKNSKETVVTVSSPNAHNDALVPPHCHEGGGGGNGSVIGIDEIINFPWPPKKGRK